MNDKLSLGSVFPQLEWAKEKGYSAIVFNPNYRGNEEGAKVPSCVSGMDRHSVFAWESYVEPSQAENIFMIAHSAGGGCAASIIDRHLDDCVK